MPSKKKRPLAKIENGTNTIEKFRCVECLKEYKREPAYVNHLKTCLENIDRKLKKERETLKSARAVRDRLKKAINDFNKKLRRR